MFVYPFQLNFARRIYIVVPSACELKNATINCQNDVDPPPKCRNGIKWSFHPVLQLKFSRQTKLESFKLELRPHTQLSGCHAMYLALFQHPPSKNVRIRCRTCNMPMFPNPEFIRSFDRHSRLSPVISVSECK